PRTRVSVLLPPVLQCVLFGYALTYDLSHVPYAVLDLDRSAASEALLAEFDGSGVFERVANLDRAADIRRFIDDRQGLLVVQIGQDFSRDLQAGVPTQVQVIADGRNSNTANTALAYVGSVVEAFGTQWRASRGLPGPPIRISMRAWYNPLLESRWNMIPALIGTLTMLQTLLLTSMSVAREREHGTFDQLLVTPLRPSEIIVGKTVPPMLVGTAQATLVLLVAQLWFRIPFEGSLLTLYAGILFFLLGAVGIGLLISSFAATMQQAMLYTFTVLAPFTLLSGLIAPIDNMPVVLQYATLIDPLRYAIDMTRRVYLEGAGFAQIVPDLWPLAVIGALTLPVAAWMFRHRLT
ncbi:MAG: ABC transporter permease, partial [Deinococcales bacterium]